jgi:hypothetical protein
MAAIEDAEAFRAAVLAWCVAWHQVPAASLPDDDALMCRLLGYGRDLPTWRRVRAAGALRGFVKCTDGRLYHATVAEKALDAWGRKLDAREAGKRGAEKRWSQKKTETIPVAPDTATPPETDSDPIATLPEMDGDPTVFDSKGQGQGQGQRKGQGKSLSPPGRVRAEARGTRLPEGWRPTPDGIDLAESLGLDPNAVLVAFSDYWRSQPGQRGRKADWDATWRTWCRHEAERLQVRRPQSASLPLLTAIEGGRPSQTPSDPADDWGVEGWCRLVAEVITDREALATGKGKWAYSGMFLDWTARQVAEAAGFGRSWRGDWSLLKAWIDDGLSTGEHILPAVKRMAAWCISQGRPAASLAVFDKAVRERRAA